MTLPTALAPTVSLATPRVERILHKVADKFGLRVTRFYLCEPSTCDAVSRDNAERWIDGMWGAELRGSRVSLNDMKALVSGDAFKRWTALSLEGFDVRAEANEVVCSVGLYGRVMR